MVARICKAAALMHDPALDRRCRADGQSARRGVAQLLQFVVKAEE